MTLSDRITAMYARSSSCLSDREDKSVVCGMEEKSCKIRFLPGLILPDCGPMHEPISGTRRTTSILKHKATSCPSSTARTTIANKSPTGKAGVRSTTVRSATTTSPALPATVGSSDERFLRELQASKILSDRRDRAISKLQARVRMIIQRKVYERLRSQVSQPELRATAVVAVCEEAPKAPTVTTSTEVCESDDDDLYDEIHRLEQKLESIKRQQQEEMGQIELWKVQEMKRIRDEVESSIVEAPTEQLTAQFNANRRCIRTLRKERKQIQDENESLRKGLSEIRAEQQRLLSEGVQIQEQTKTLQSFVTVASKRNEDWTKASLQYEAHVAQTKSMIAEREARTAMEESIKDLYSHAVHNIEQRLASQQGVYDHNELELVVNSIDAACTLLHVA